MAQEEETTVENPQAEAKPTESIKATSGLTGLQKAAILLISLGVEKAAEILKNLKDDEVEKLTIAIAEMQDVESDMVKEVREEYHELIISKEFLLEGGTDYAYDLLAASLGEEKAKEIMKKHEQDNRVDPFALFESAKEDQVLQFLKNEQPQVAAVILAHLNVDKAAEILMALPDEFQADVAYRLANMNNISSEVVEELKDTIMDEMDSGYEKVEDILTGSSAVANILNEASIATERKVLENIDKYDPELVKEIKKQMFLFEDILEVEDLTLQAIIAKLDKDDMVTGLKGVDEALKEKFIENMSKRASEILLDDLEALGPVHVKQVEEAQQNIIRTIRKLEADGDISIRKNDSENIIE